MRYALATALVVAGLLANAAPAAAERLVASLTNHRVMITSNYTGVELVLFGSVEREQRALRAAGPTISSRPSSGRGSRCAHGANSAYSASG